MDTVEISKNFNDFDKNGCCFIENILSDDCRKFLVNQLMLDELDMTWGKYLQVEGSEEIYNTRNLNIINQILKDKIKDSTKAENLYSTYAFYRKYFKGQKLKKHTDRPECEISVTICLATSDDNKEWPIYLQNEEQQIIYKGSTKPGCGVIYKGCQLLHWRDECEHQWVKQIFSHYSTDRNLEFDNRTGKNDSTKMLSNLIKTITENL